MKVDITKDRTIYIRWQYNGPMTYCFIENAFEYILKSAMVGKHYHDKYDKEKARKAALMKALRMLYPYVYHNPRVTNENQIIRAKVWEAYRTMTKIPKWKRPCKLSKEINIT